MALDVGQQTSADQQRLLDEWLRSPAGQQAIQAARTSAGAGITGSGMQSGDGVANTSGATAIDTPYGKVTLSVGMDGGITGIESHDKYWWDDPYGEGKPRAERAIYRGTDTSQGVTQGIDPTSGGIIGSQAAVPWDSRHQTRATNASFGRAVGLGAGLIGAGYLAGGVLGGSAGGLTGSQAATAAGSGLGTPGAATGAWGTTSGLSAAELAAMANEPGIGGSLYGSTAPAGTPVSLSSVPSSEAGIINGAGGSSGLSTNSTGTTLRALEGANQVPYGSAWDPTASSYTNYMQNGGIRGGYDYLNPGSPVTGYNAQTNSVIGSNMPAAAPSPQVAPGVTPPATGASWWQGILDWGNKNPTAALGVMSSVGGVTSSLTQSRAQDKKIEADKEASKLALQQRLIELQMTNASRLEIEQAIAKFKAEEEARKYQGVNDYITGARWRTP